MPNYEYQKSSVDLDLLTCQINRSSEISQNVSNINWNEPSSLIVCFSESLNSSEQSALSTIVSDHVESQGGFYEDWVYIEVYEKGRLIKEEWYESINENNSPQNKYKEIEYSYDRNKCMSGTERIFFKNGDVAKTVNLVFYQERDNNIRKFMKVRIEV